MGGHPLARGLAALAPLVLLPALAACSGDEPSDGPSAAASPTDAPTTTPSAVFVRSDSVAPRDGSAGALGSGCGVPGGAPLPDGVWFGLSDDITADSLRFDLACLYVGDEALVAAAAAGEEALDFYIANDDPGAVVLSWAPDAQAYRMDGTVTAVSVADFAADPFGPTYSPGWSPVAVWVWVNAGVVTEVEAVYFP